MHYVRVAKSVIRRADGKYLVFRCSEWPERPDRSLKPDLPGGAVELGESLEQGVSREVREESGIQIHPDDFLIGYANSFIYEDRDRQAVVRSVYFAEVENPEIALSYEHDRYWWVSLDEMLAMEWKPFYREAFEFMKQSELLK
ncbi:MAG TPA: NUDIX domain-containing protein [Candidatus Saccharimonadales bacterium]